AAVDGTSIETLSVSISNRLSPGLIGSPADLNHWVILPSATVSPSCGINTSIPPPRRAPLPRERDVLGLQEFHQPLMGAFAPDAGLLHSAEGGGGIGNESAIEPDHSELELLGDAHAAAHILRIEIRDETVFGVVGPLDHFGFRLEGLDRRDG